MRDMAAMMVEFNFRVCAARRDGATTSARILIRRFFDRFTKRLLLTMTPSQTLFCTYTPSWISLSSGIRIRSIQTAYATVC